MSDDSSDLENSAFISFASPDAAVANTIVEKLEQQGIRCWIAPRDVVPGSLYADGIVRAINGTQHFVLVLSEHALASKHVGKEMERASSKGHPIFAIRTDGIPLTPTFEYFLSESRWIDVGTTGIDTAVAKLVSAMRKSFLRSRDPFAIDQIGRTYQRRTRLHREEARQRSQNSPAGANLQVSAALRLIVCARAALRRGPFTWARVQIWP